MSRPKKLVLAVVSLLLALAVSCGPAASPTAAPATVAAPTEAASEPVTINFWFEGAASGTLAIFQESFDRFEALHPNVTIEAVPVPFEEMLRTMTLALDAGTGPDIATVPPLDSITFRAARAGHLLELGALANERGWLERYDMKAIQVNNAGLDGIFGIPFEWTVVGVYYNKQVFNELGLAPPQSIAEFESHMEALKAAGHTPISVGGRDGWPLDHVWQQLVHTNVEYSVLRALEDLDPNASWEHPALAEAAYKMKEWADKDWLDPNMLSTGFLDANNLFINGEAAMNIGGTWVQADFRGADFEVGFFAVPAMRPELTPHLGGFTPFNDIVIVKGSPNEAWATELLDYLVSEENMAFWWQQGLLVPYNFDPLPAQQDDLQVDIYSTMSASQPGHFITVSAPETSRVLWAVLQEIAGGSKTPEQAFAEVQETYEGEVQ